MDISALVAGTKYRGDVERSLKVLLGDIKDKYDGIVLIDDIHTTIGVGSAGDSSMYIDNMVKLFSVSRDLKCIELSMCQGYSGIF